jgi:TonB family protein
MTASDGYALLVETTLASSIAMLMVLLFRHPVRRAFGSGAAYALWALVPALVVAVLVPAALEPVAPARVLAAPVMAMAAPVLDAGESRGSVMAWLPWLWSLGAVATVSVLFWRQRRYVAGLGPLRQRPDGHFQSLATRGLPAVLGLRARIVLPGDFEQRYSPLERQLIIAHESEHLRRGDLPACALAVALRALFWFNPLVHAAANRFRHDQELACDASVLQRFPDRRRQYGDAMLKTQLADQPLPLGCHWFGSHPLKERLAMLTRPTLSVRRRAAGLFLVALLGLATTALAWATQPGQPADIPAGKLLLELAIKVDGAEAKTVRIVMSPGVAHDEDFEHAGQQWQTRWTVTPLADGTFDMMAKLIRDGEVVAEPRMIVRDTAAIGVGDQKPDGSFTGIEVELKLSLGPPAPGMAAVGIQGEVPRYPSQAQAEGEGGLVVLRLRVGADGRVLESHYVPERSTVPYGSPLVRSTLETAKEWRLDPPMQDGKPVAGWVMVPVRFEADPGEG